MNNKNMNNNKNKKEILEAPLSHQLTDEKIYSDVNGSYTGMPLDGGEPVQDADDL